MYQQFSFYIIYKITDDFTFLTKTEQKHRLHMLHMLFLLMYLQLHCKHRVCKMWKYLTWPAALQLCFMFLYYFVRDVTETLWRALKCCFRADVHAVLCVLLS